MCILCDMCTPRLPITSSSTYYISFFTWLKSIIYNITLSLSRLNVFIRSGGFVVGGPAPRPLPIVFLEYDKTTGDIYAIGTNAPYFSKSRPSSNLIYDPNYSYQIPKKSYYLLSSSLNYNLNYG